MPDLNYCKDGVEGWVENKACDHWRCTIRPMQVGWAERRLIKGGRVFLAVRRCDTELWLYHGAMMRRLTVERLDVVPHLGHWRGGAARWDWAGHPGDPAIQPSLMICYTVLGAST